MNINSIFPNQSENKKSKTKQKYAIFQKYFQASTHTYWSHLSLHKYETNIHFSKYKYYLMHEKECFIIFKTRGAAERFRYDKTRLFECIE